MTISKKACALIEKSNDDSNHIWRRAQDAFQNLTGEEIPKICKLATIHPRAWNKVVPCIDWSVKAKVRAGQPPMLGLIAFREVTERKYQGYAHWYTDGSLAEGKVGYGVVGPDTRLEASLAKQCSVFTAEAKALSQATKHARNRSVIFSDSASCLAALESGKSKNCYIQLIEADIEGKDIRFCWIPGHSGIPGNEKADDAARCGRNRSIATEEVPCQDTSKWIQKMIWKAHQNTWSQNPRTTLKIVKSGVGKLTDRTDRKEQIVLTRLRLGHSIFNKKHIFEKKEPEVCTLCNRKVTVHHVLAACQRYDSERLELGINNNLAEILSNEKDAEDKVIRFVKRIGLFSSI